MKKVMGIVALMVLVLAVTPAAADFYVIAGGGRVGTQISSLPYTITTPGLYYLANNLSIASTISTAITVNADDVTLDLMGFCLTGPGKTGAGSTDGIHIQDSGKNVEIRNGCIKNFGNAAIYGLSCKGIRVIGVRVRDAAQGIYISGTGHVVAGCSAMGITGQGIGAYISNISGLIKGNHVIGNGIGICAGPGSTVEDNLALNNGGEGIKASSGYCTITGNTARGNTNAGIVAGDYSTVTNNTTQGLSYGPNCAVANNTVY